MWLVVAIIAITVIAIVAVTLQSRTSWRCNGSQCEECPNADCPFKSKIDCEKQCFDEFQSPCTEDCGSSYQCFDFKCMPCNDKFTECQHGYPIYETEEDCSAQCICDVVDSISIPTSGKKMFTHEGQEIDKVLRVCKDLEQVVFKDQYDKEYPVKSKYSCMQLTPNEKDLLIEYCQNTSICKC